jgi:hypothetical protein
MMFSAVARGDMVQVIVPGSADPWLAGMPDGSTASLGDFAPQQSPVDVPGLGYSSGGVLTFSVKGSVNYGGGPPVDPPDGNFAFVVQHATGAENGISNVIAPVDSLLGVFLGPDQPNLTGAPGTLDFSTSAARDASSFSPELKQVFFIGDGLAPGGVTQQFVIPDGATRLFLGTMNGFGWWNNSGSFQVDVTGPALAAVPEPSSAWLLTVGALSVAALARLRRGGRLGTAARSNPEKNAD